MTSKTLTTPPNTERSSHTPTLETFINLAVEVHETSLRLEVAVAEHARELAERELAGKAPIKDAAPNPSFKIPMPNNAPCRKHKP